MKKITFLKTLLMVVMLLIGNTILYAQTTINFDTDANWIQAGSTSLTSYGNHAYVESGVTIQGTNVLRNTTSTQDGFAGAIGKYSMRVGNTESSKVAISIPTGGLGEFSIKIRRWDNSPMPNYTVKYTTNGGTDWTSLTNIDGTLLTTSDFFTYSSGTINSSASNIVIEIQNTSTTERIMIDDFTWTGYGSSTPTVAAPTFDPAAGTYTSAQNVTISTTTDGASIYYTTNGDEPTESSTLYTAPVAISTTTTLKAKAYKAGMDPSATATAVYTINQAPTITVTETALSGFTYVVDNGPSDAQQFTFSGSNLTEDLTVTAPANYQISIDGANDNYHNSLAFTPVSGSVANTSLYVRLIAGLTAGDYTGNITLTSTGAAQKTIALSGKVTLPVVKPAVIISEVYGGGGNSGATLINDFIELYNTSNETVEIGGWSVQYYSENGNGAATESNIFVIPEGKYIPAGAHFLIKAAAGSGGTEYLFQPDAACNLALRATGGKIILYNTSAAQNITDINSITSNPNFVDYVPYGTTAVPVWGSAMSSNTSNTTSASRKIVPPALIGAQKVRSAVNYVYTGNIGNDFTVTTPSPTSTGLNTGVNNTKLELSIYPSNGKIHFNATSGEKIEIFNAVGQRIVNKLSTDGLNSISVDAKGVLLVKVGERIGKVIL